MLARAGCSKMPRKSFLNRSRKLPGTSRSSLWPSWGSFCPLWASWGAPGALLGRSGEPLGSLLDPPRPSNIAPGGSPGGPPHRSLILAPFWGSFWLHFGTPRTSKYVVFVWRVCHFSKKRGVRKNTLKTETWLSRNGKRVKSESRKHRKRRRRRGDEHKQRREEARQSTTRHSREFLVRLFRSFLARPRGRLRKHTSRSASL